MQGLVEAGNAAHVLSQYILNYNRNFAYSRPRHKHIEVCATAMTNENQRQETSMACSVRYGSSQDKLISTYFDHNMIAHISCCLEKPRSLSACRLSPALHGRVELTRLLQLLILQWLNSLRAGPADSRRLLLLPRARLRGRRSRSLSATSPHSGPGARRQLRVGADDPSDTCPPPRRVASLVAAPCAATPQLLAAAKVAAHGRRLTDSGHAEKRSASERCVSRDAVKGSGGRVLKASLTAKI